MPFQKAFNLAVAAAAAIVAASSGRAAEMTTPSSSKAAAASGLFQPTWESLAQYYECPEWFRDAKFGIWAHWSAQCVPEQGDWYARHIYIEGHPHYTFQLEHYGHPSLIGFKDIDYIWHAEKWDPDHLMQLYKKAGAQYFFALANHHDNFDCYDSKYQPWNSVNIGPKKDIVGLWAQAARKYGLRFGVSVHAAHAWSWFEVAQGADKKGPWAGMPYDGKLTKADGKGKWWEGLDPQDLYAQNHAPGRNSNVSEIWDWDATKGSSVPDAEYCERFYNRTIDLIDKYHPDQIYFDDTVLPLWPVSDVGLRIAAHFYNANMQWHSGKLDAVINGKKLSDEQRKCMVWDIERGKSDRIEPLPWQTDTCIGHWHYDRSLFEKHKYKNVAEVVRMLVDIVSKNGNLMLSIPVRGDGSIDEDEITFLEGMAKWMQVNGEAIFGTRPWEVFGEGPSVMEKVEAGQFGGARDVRSKPYTAEDVRFTKKGNALYAVLMALPKDKRTLITSLATGSPQIANRKVSDVTLLGYNGKLTWSQDESGLRVELPDNAPSDYTAALKIIGVTE